MTKEFNEKLKVSICNVIDEGVLDDEDIGEILRICREASDRKVAELTESYLTARIEGDIQ